jgi:WD40 repeat protein
MKTPWWLLGRAPINIVQGLTYNAFMSYSHAADGRLAPALQQGLHRFARPWNRLRALRIFRDNASLSANPALWPAIEQGLGESQFFILLASPEAAQSWWVSREVSYWISHKPLDRIIIVLTEGEIVWDAAACRFDRDQTTALPPQLHNAFADEPRWIDMRWARTAEHLSLDRPDFRDCIADVAAPVHGRPKDELIGEDVRQFRKLTAVRRIAVSLIALLAALATSVGVAAVDSRNRALRTQSRFLVDLSRQERELGETAVAVYLALEALPRHLAANGAGINLVGRARLALTWLSWRIWDRPYLAEAETALYLAVEGNRERIRFVGDQQPLINLWFTPDGAHLITGAWDNTTRVWEISDGRPVLVLRGTAKGAASQDGTRIIVVGQPAIFDTASGSEVIHFKEDLVEYSAFSPDGAKVVTVSQDHTTRTWDSTSGKQLLLLRGHKFSALFAAFSPDSRQLVTTYSGGRTVMIWDADTGRELHALQADEKLDSPIYAAEFNKNGTKLVFCFGSEVQLWDPQFGRRLAIFHAENYLTFATFSPDGTKILATSVDGTALLWDTASLARTGVLNGHSGAVNHASFSPDSSLVITASDDGTAMLWDANSAKVRVIFGGHRKRVTRAIFSPDGTTVATASDDGTARLWDARRGQELRILRAHAGAVVFAGFDRQGSRILTASGDQTARIWDARSGKQLAVLEGHADRLSAAAFSPNGKKVVTASADGDIRIWDAGKFKELTSLSSNGSIIKFVTFNSNGTKLLAVSQTGQAWLWDTDTRRMLAHFSDEDGLVTAAAFSPEGTSFVIGCRNGKVELYDTETGQRSQSLVGFTNEITSLAYSPDGSSIVAGSSVEAKIWLAANGRQVAAHHGTDLSSIGFTSDGDGLVWTGTGKTELWDRDFRNRLTVFQGASYPAAMSPTSQILATVGTQTVTLWEVASGRPLTRLNGHGSHINSAMFSPDGTMIVTASADGTARTWRVLPVGQGLMELAEREVPWSLTAEQREKFFLDPQ